MNASDFIRNRVRQAREDARLSQREMAELLGISQATVSGVERGRVQMSAKDLAQFAIVLDKPITFFFPAGAEANDEQERMLLDLFRSAPEWQEKILAEVRLQIELYKRVQPYLRAGIPEEFYTFLLWDELERLELEQALEGEEIPDADVLQQRYHEWRKRIDRQRGKQA